MAVMPGISTTHCVMIPVCLPEPVFTSAAEASYVCVLEAMLKSSGSKTDTKDMRARMHSIAAAAAAEVTTRSKMRPSLNLVQVEICKSESKWFSHIWDLNGLSSREIKKEEN